MYGLDMGQHGVASGTFVFKEKDIINMYYLVKGVAYSSLLQYLWLVPLYP